ncbi:MAG: hypothetical protein N2572_04875 [Syntrophales bacterium]|nr:hypothetical protein [Syntrophales bacterium]
MESNYYQKTPFITLIINDSHGIIESCAKSYIKAVSEHPIEITIIGSKGNPLCQFNSSDSIIYMNVAQDCNDPVPALMNSIASQAKGKFLLFMTSPLEIKGKWFESLISCLTSTGAEGVTSKIIYRNSIVEAGYSLLEDGTWIGYGEGAEPTDPKYNFINSIEKSSRFALLISKRTWNEVGRFDDHIKNIQLALFDLGLKLISRGYKVVYNPFCTFLLRSAPPEFNEKKVEALRPTIPFYLSHSEKSIKKKILILGVYLTEKSNNAKDIIRLLSKTQYHEVKQEWAAIGKNRIDEELENYTVLKLAEPKPKFLLLNDMLQRHNLHLYDYIIISDDDIILPFGFLDEFIYLQDKHGFYLAQPARTSNSYIDHPIVEKQNGILARQTMYVEIGPLFSIHRNAFNVILPFDVSSPMGWGYGNVWSHEFHSKGLKMGIIDHTPVDHSIRRPVENYSWKEADEQRKNYLSKHPHLKLEECFRVLEVINY